MTENTAVQTEVTAPVGSAVVGHEAQPKTQQAAAPKAATKKAAKKTATASAPVKKAAGTKKGAAKKATKKSAGAQAAPAKKTEPAKKAVKGGLRKPQVRILQFLGAHKKPATRAEIAAGAPVDVATCVEYLGSHDKAKREANDKKHFPSLLTLKFVVATQNEGEPVVYSITDKGREEINKPEYR
jgi:hypothetical protein